MCVALHVRPLIPREIQEGCRNLVMPDPLKPEINFNFAGRQESFRFDAVYGEGAVPSHLLYQQTVEPLVESLFLGYHATIFAYGQTGSGKSYTMGTDVQAMAGNSAAASSSLDTSASSGESYRPVTQRVMKSIFERFSVLKQQGVQVEMYCSFIEIYQVRRWQLWQLQHCYHIYILSCAPLLLALP